MTLHILHQGGKAKAAKGKRKAAKGRSKGGKAKGGKGKGKGKGGKGGRGNKATKRKQNRIRRLKKRIPMQEARVEKARDGVAWAWAWAWAWACVLLGDDALVAPQPPANLLHVRGRRGRWRTGLRT